MEEWMVKVMEVSEMAKQTVLIKENDLFNLISTWKLLLDFCSKLKTMTFWLLGFDD